MSTPVYATPYDVKQSLGLTASTFADDDITAAIAAASRAIDQQTSRRFYPDNDANQVRTFLPQHPGYCIIDDLVEFTSLEAQDSTWVLNSDFYLEPTNAAADARPFTAIRTIARPFIFTLSQIPAGWAGFDGRITVTGMWGWAAAPDEIATATKILASRLLRRVREAPLGVVSLGSEMEAVRLGRADPDVAALVGPYARVVLF